MAELLREWTIERDCRKCIRFIKYEKQGDKKIVICSTFLRVKYPVLGCTSYGVD